MSFSFRIDHTVGAARSGILAAPHGEVETPAFMPVGTLATVEVMGLGRVELPTSRLSGSFIRTRIRLRSSYSPAFHEHPAQHVAHLRTSCALPRTFCASEWTPQRTPFTVR